MFAGSCGVSLFPRGAHPVCLTSDAALYDPSPHRLFWSFLVCFLRKCWTEGLLVPRLGPNVDADFRVATPKSKHSGCTFPSNLDLYLFRVATGVSGLAIKACTPSGSTSRRAHVIDMSSVRRTTTCWSNWLRPSWMAQDPSLLYTPVGWKGLKGKAPLEKVTNPPEQGHLETRDRRTVERNNGMVGRCNPRQGASWTYKAMHET